MAVCMCSYMYAYGCVMLPNLITVANACKTLFFSPPSAIPTMRLSQDFSRLLLLFLVNSPILVVYDFFLLQVLSNIVHPNFVLYEFLSLLPGSDQSSPGRVRRPVGPKRLLLPLSSTCCLCEPACQGSW